MEPSTTSSNQIHHKTLTPTTTDLEHGHEPLIISCKIDSSPHQGINACEKRLRNEPLSREKPALVMKEVTKVIIPEKWGKENLLKDWMDYSTFDDLLAPKEARSAREALVAEARREYI